VWLEHHEEGTNILFYCFGIGSVEKNNRVVLLDGGNCARGGKSDYCVIYDHSEKDKQLIKTMIDGMPKVAKALGAEVVRVKENPPGSALHEIGGLRMGKDPATSVTDPNGRFWRYQNLYVADSSTWRNQGAANPYLTITACSLRLARKIVTDKHARLARTQKI
jgi:choline dehydrogenase-like flavoprotein